MAQRLPRLRANLDFAPSPVADRPGLLIRDSLRYSDTSLIIPPLLVECLRCFDGEATDLDLRRSLVNLTGDLRVGELEQHLAGALSEAGFLEDEVYEKLRGEKHRVFEESPVRIALHAGLSYSSEPDALSAELRDVLDHDGPRPAMDGLAAIAAPHVSLEGGRSCYQAAYGALRAEHKERTFVILGTSHYGEAGRFGLTRKRFVTPLGEAVTDVTLVEELNHQAGPAVIMEDYCHAVEHSIEFQLLFLQHLYGSGVRILPILCGSYARSIYEGGVPEDDAAVGRFLGALGELAAREGRRLLWVLGVDMAHIGRRYGDAFAVEAHRGAMDTVAEKDRGRIELVTSGDARGFWQRVQEGHDELRWCGASAIYTFLKAAPEARGELLRYDQWSIDGQSVVSFGAIAFRR